MSIRTSILASVVSTLVLQGAVAVAEPIALGVGGEVFRLHAGPADELVAGSSSDAPILALETASGETLLVPGTGDALIEHHPRLFSEARGGDLLVLWYRVVDGIGSTHFVSFDGAAFSTVEVIGLGGEAAAMAAPPAVVATRDVFTMELGDEGFETRRKVLHLLWNGAFGGVYYTPLILLEGRYVGWHDSFDLAAQFGSPAEDAIPLPAALSDLAQLAVSSRGGSVVAAFALPDHGTLAAIEVGILPLEVSVLGDGVRESLYELAELYDPGDLTSFTDGAIAQIINIGARYRLNPTVVEFVSGQIGGWLEANGGDYGYAGFEQLGNDARDRTIDVTRELYATAQVDPANDSATIIEIDLGGFIDEIEGDATAQILEVQVGTEQDAPAMPIGPAPSLFASANGRDLLLAWPSADGRQIHFVESYRGVAEGAWSAPRSIDLDDRLDAATALGLLERRIR